MKLLPILVEFRATLEGISRGKNPSAVRRCLPSPLLQGLIIVAEISEEKNLLSKELTE